MLICVKVFLADGIDKYQFGIWDGRSIVQRTQSDLRMQAKLNEAIFGLQPVTITLNGEKFTGYKPKEHLYPIKNSSVFALPFVVKGNFIYILTNKSGEPKPVVCKAHINSRLGNVSDKELAEVLPALNKFMELATIGDTANKASTGCIAVTKIKKFNMINYMAEKYELVELSTGVSHEYKYDNFMSHYKNCSIIGMQWIDGKVIPIKGFYLDTDVRGTYKLNCAWIDNAKFLVVNRQDGSSYLFVGGVLQPAPAPWLLNEAKKHRLI